MSDVRTASTTRPDEALTPLTATTAPRTQVATPVPTQKSGSMPFAIIEALILVSLIRAIRKPYISFLVMWENYPPSRFFLRGSGTG